MTAVRYVGFLLLVALCWPVYGDAPQPHIALTHVRGNVYVIQDPFYFPENSVVYIGDESVTVIGATWTPETAKELVGEIRKITSKPISEVVDPDFHLDRVGGNAYFRSIGVHVVSTRMTYELLLKKWEKKVKGRQAVDPTYPTVPKVLPDQTHPGNFELQGGHIRAFYLGPAHTPDGIFLYFTAEKILYAGCIILEHLGDFTDGDLKQYPITLRKLKALELPIDTVIAGHWSPLHGPELIDQYLVQLAARSH